jgi:hypothetical protein
MVEQLEDREFGCSLVVAWVWATIAAWLIFLVFVV